MWNIALFGTHNKRCAVALGSRPAKHHHATVDEDRLTLRTPALTALQLYVDGVLPGVVEIAVGDDELGSFEVEELRTPDEMEFGEPVIRRFRRVTST